MSTSFASPLDRFELNSTAGGIGCQVLNYGFNARSFTSRPGSSWNASLHGSHNSQRHVEYLDRTLCGAFNFLKTLDETAFKANGSIITSNSIGFEQNLTTMTFELNRWIREKRLVQIELIVEIWYWEHEPLNIWIMVSNKRLGNSLVDDDDDDERNSSRLVFFSAWWTATDGHDNGHCYFNHLSQQSSIMVYGSNFPVFSFSLRLAGFHSFCLRDLRTAWSASQVKTGWPLS